MKKFMHNYATPLTVGLFGISTISGAALFFHLQSGLFHQMHEWLSMVLLLPFVLHMWKNWSALLGYVKRRTLLVPVVGTLVLAAAFVVPSIGRHQVGGPPPMRAVELLTHARLDVLAGLLNRSTEDLTAELSKRGIAVSSSAQTLQEVALAAKTPAGQLLLNLISSDKGGEGR